MRLVTYKTNEDALCAGVLVGNTVVNARDCSGGLSEHGAIDLGSVRAILAAGRGQDLVRMGARAEQLAESHGKRLDDVTLLPPIPDPEKILCIGLNYRDHVEEAQRDVDPTLGTQPDPIVFSKFATALVADGDPVVLPAAAPEMVDWEGELAVVIGRTCSRVTREEALGCVAGYTVFNDVSARDLQMASPQWLMGKSFDTSAPCGPALVTADEVSDPQRLTLTTTVNGELMQETSTALMINPIARLIEYISSLITLGPGDIIATGTPSGVGFARDPKVFLRPGDTVVVAIDGVGKLSNSVRAA